MARANSSAVQSACLTRRMSGVRIPLRPLVYAACYGGKHTVRALQFAVALSIGVAVPLCAQQLSGPQQPTERLLILPFMASPADSAASIALADAVRDRVNALVKSKVMVVPKAKLCEALQQSGFPCNGLLDDQQARQLARFLQVHSYVTGTLVKNGAALSANVEMIDIGSSGISGRFPATNG